LFFFYILLFLCFLFDLPAVLASCARRAPPAD
jgi:hypothetical protein